MCLHINFIHEKLVPFSAEDRSHVEHAGESQKMLHEDMEWIKFRWILNLEALLMQSVEISGR